MTEKKITCYPKTIIETNRGQDIPRSEFNPADIHHMINPYQNSPYDGYDILPGASSVNEPRRYHYWENLQELTHGGEAQCGRPVTAAWIDDIVDGIHYYRDTGAIAGVSGTYCKPATLKLCNFDFVEKGLNEHCRINSVGVVFDHRRTAVCTPDDGTPPFECERPRTNLSLGLSMDGLEYYPKYKALRHWLSLGNTPITAVFGDGERIPNPPHQWDDARNIPIYQTIAQRHMGNSNPQLTIENLLNPDFSLIMEYGANLMGDRGILYLRNVRLEIFYEEGKPYITHATTTDTIRTSKYNKCKTITEHHILSGFVDSKNFPIPPKKPFDELTPKEQDEQYCFHHVKVRESSIPEGVTVRKKEIKNSVVIYEVEDGSDIEGDKNIEYYLDNHGIGDLVPFKSIKAQRPHVSAIQKYKKRAPYVPGTQYIILQSEKNGCCDTLTIYIDSIENEPLVFDIKYIADGINMLNYNAAGEEDDTYIHQFYNKMQTLSCGKHKLFIQIGSNTPIEEYIEMVIEIIPQEFVFKIYDPNNPTLTYDQNKDYPNQELKIKRIDDEPSETIDVIVNDESKLDHEEVIIHNMRKGIEYSYITNKYYPGRFNITAEEAIHECSKGKNTVTITVNPADHKQYHDELFVRTEDSTSVTNKYLVAWEGDNIKFPITVDSVEKGHSIDDILLCSREMTYTGLSQIGLLPLTVRNIGDSGVIKNCQIELNVLDKLEDGSFQVTTDDWTQTNGIFYNFYKKFLIYNQDILDKVEIKNIDENNNISHSFSITGEENVYIKIKELPEDESITIMIPFSSRSPKEKYLEYRIFQDVVKFNTASCYVPNENQADKVAIYVYDSILTDLSIEGKTDILNPATTIDDCPIVCYKTEPEKDGEPEGITYRVTNIDTSNYSDAGISPSTIAPLKIENDIEMVPYAYKFKDGEKTEWHGEESIDDKLIFKQKAEDHEFSLANELINAHIQFSEEETPKILKQRTNKDGEVIFYIEIPRVYNKKYTITELLSDVVYIEYSGSIEYLPSSIEIGNLHKLETQIIPYGLLYNNQFYEISSTTKIPANKYVQLLYTIQYKYNNKWYLLNDKSVYIYKGLDAKQIVISNSDKENKYNIIGKTITTEAQTPKQIFNQYNVLFKGDALYQTYNPAGIIIQDDRDTTKISFVDDWKVYKPGQIVPIKVELHAVTDIIKNYILFNANINEPSSYDEVTIYYKMCNLQGYQCNISKIDFDKLKLCEKNKGIFTTTFSTDTYKLVENQTSRNIYCGIDNDIKLITKLEKKTIQSGDINVIYLNLLNKVKDSKDVKVYIDLGSHPDIFLGDYDYINIENTEGDFSYYIEDSADSTPIIENTSSIEDNSNSENESTNQISFFDNECPEIPSKTTTTKLIWAIGDMLANTEARAIIKIKADQIGLSDINIQVEDYNHRLDDEEETIVGQDPCKDWECNG